MKTLIIILVFFNISAKAQTYTTAKLSTYIRDQWKTNDSLRKSIASLQAKLAMKDTRDDERNQRIDLLFSDNAQLKKSNDSLKLAITATKKGMDSMKLDVASANKKDTLFPSWPITTARSSPGHIDFGFDSALIRKIDKLDSLIDAMLKPTLPQTGYLLFDSPSKAFTATSKAPTAGDITALRKSIEAVKAEVKKAKIYINPNDFLIDSKKRISLKKQKSK